ncbi:ATP-binding protein [Streptomyces sp. TRM75563]|uniref:ATP-binding protein n=1 Tax=Streptomyces sp. TRM75563 TaxID=2817418 RepID=UPI001F611210|nr:ATP-binding protein [Streptomyces sp. TRM75563]MCI4045491.1 ATP-binding protein [Streptomyces sp. TRM75563]
MMTMGSRALPSPGGGQPPSVPPQLILAAEPQSARAARRFVREAAAYQEPDTPEKALGTLELLASELATNALLHGGRAAPGSSVRVVVDARPGRTRVEVHDACPTLPYIRPTSTMSERGRGLLLVSLMAAAWGSADRDTGKMVWAVVTW